MDLLHLPVEVFAEIIHAYLEHSRWSAAVRARYVCKTFAAAIHHDIFGRYSSTYYWYLRPDWKERLLGPNMHTFLYKMSPTRCNSTYVLDHMDATVDFLMDFSYYKTQSQRERYHLALCNAMSAALCVNDILAYLRDGPRHDSVSIRKNMGRADTVGMLAAAAAVGSEPALRFLVGKVRHVGQCSELYGTPLIAAAVNGHKHATKFIYERLEDCHRKWDHLYDTIDTCMYKQRATMLPTLMAWYLESCDSGRVIYEAKYEWCKWAIVKGELDVVRCCYNFKRAIKSDRQSRLTPFYLACEHGQVHIIQYFLELDATLGEATYTCDAGRIGARGLSQGLIIAVQNGWLVAARLLIENGAQISKSKLGDTVCAPVLWHAVERGHVGIVALLLSYGVMVPAKNSARHVGFWNLTVKRGMKMASLIEEAWKAQVEMMSVHKLDGIV